MAHVRLDGIAHSYSGGAAEADWALKTLDHDWRDGGAYALLGPSGCGKTTLLNVISGLIIPTRGRILFDGKDVTALPTEARNIAQVFQFPVIYDTMTVYDNLAFPLRNRGFPGPEIDRLVRQVAGMLDLADDIGRRARNLSADAKQKISLGRGLVRPDVAAILFDEPLTVIDPHMKWKLRRKLKEIHEQYRLTLVYVTHDQNEALTFADTIVVMHEGRILQVGSPQALFERPQHTFVGYFIGSPGMNLIDCRLDGETARIGEAAIPLAGALKGAAGTAPSGALRLGIRPEFLTLHDAQGPGRVEVAIRTVEDLGNYRIVTALLGDTALKIKLDEEAPIPADRAWLAFPPGRTLLYHDDRLIEASP
ncbi:ABC transporter ATP-binding protein [Oceanibacterium hippocampi]|uniref:sn-glycerol-3-phosphate import ATP-binding protein UgpC n=1 Tax=Oceanibacterium hippocampi TaxID=745714 RepID=A0A1Y5RWX4_9PROT|nr:ABC transporter ATP-binding protein [Oceanibacterium hippocampi]SLN27362.1 sn-glycerol-3-phosphate import ATP-binding protein UgpC [Oceanibacterium hippocampi]